MQIDQTETQTALILGAGPAGLTAAWEIQRLVPHIEPKVFEAGDLVGGIARTEEHRGYRFDIGGHRFFTKVPEVEALWHDILGEDLLTRPRLSRIYYRGRYYDYPLKLFNALSNIGVYEAARIMASYAKWQVRPMREEKSFEQWVINRFGGRLYMHFFRSYTQKVWGIPPNRIQADWAAQRIKNLSLVKAVWNALTGANDTSSLIEEFQYPRLGPGQMWERAAERIGQAGGEVRMRERVVEIHREGSRVTGCVIESEVASGSEGGVAIEGEAEGQGTRRFVPADHVISTLALDDLIAAFRPAPPEEVVAAAKRLRYRDFLIVTLVLDHADPFPDNWIYVHSPEVRVGRIQNFRAWSPEMVPGEDTASIGMEYFCNRDDDLWTMEDEDLVRLAAREIEKLNLAEAEDAVDGFVIRQPKAYPVYDEEYRAAVDVISDWIRSLENFQTVGRNGLHRYNNQDHSMLTAMLAVRNLAGEDHDIWSVNTERSYHEDFVRTEPNAA